MPSKAASERTAGRIKRRVKVDRSFTEGTYRRAKKYLLSDFEYRCAYSMQHIGLIGSMEIDHHNPFLRDKARNEYRNLYLSSRHCNGAKSQKWEKTDPLGRTVRILDPCAVQDFGEVIFEDPMTFLLVGTTPDARWHILACDLNADHLVLERQERAHFRVLLGLLALLDVTDEVAGVEDLKKRVEKMPPPIPSLPTPP